MWHDRLLLAYAPTNRNIQDTTALIDELKQSVQNAPVIRREHEQASQNLQAVTQRLQKLRSGCRRTPRRGNSSDKSRKSPRSSTSPSAIFNRRERPTRDGYAEMEVALTGKGSFESIAAFFDRLSRLPRLSKVKSLTLSTGSTPNEYPMKATLVIYFGLQDADTKTAARKGVRRG